MGYKANDERQLAEAKAIRDAAAAVASMRDIHGIANKGVAAMKASAAEQFGDAHARQALVMAEDAGVKKVGERAWEVTGHYDGPDKEGVRFKAPWTARIELVGATLSCLSIQLGNVSWKDTPPPARSFASMVNSPSSPAKGSGGPGASPAPNSGSTSGPNAKTKAKAKRKVATPAEKAAAELVRGEAIKQAGRSDEALNIYKGIVRDYPDTPSASTAQSYVDSMLGKPKMKK